MARLFTMPMSAAVPQVDTAFRVGTGTAFSETVERHQSMVYSVAFRFCRSHELAEEVAQEVFLELYRSQPVFHTADHLVFWLRKTTSHRCIDQSRRGKLKRQLGLQEISEPGAWLPLRDPLLQRHIDETLARLPESPRLVMILRYQEDLEPAEIAALLDMPVSTVKSHLQRSLAVLRAKLGLKGGG